MRTTLGLAAMVGGVALASCMADEPEPEGEVTQGVTMISLPFFSGTDLDLGPDTDKTCFLQGVKGSLRGASSWQDDTYTTASGGVFQSGGHWHVHTNPGSGPGFEVKVGCIMNATANRVTIAGSQSGTSSTALVTANRHCFLTSISGHGMGWMANLPDQPNGPPGVALMDDAPGPSWRIVVDLVENSTTASNGAFRGGASAVCVDIPNAHPVDFTHVGGTYPLPISQTYVSQYSCGLTQILGVIDDGFDERGIELFHDGSPDWVLQVHNQYRTTAHCVR